jgi:hypothetical protein
MCGFCKNRFSEYNTFLEGVNEICSHFLHVRCDLDRIRYRRCRQELTVPLWLVNIGAVNIMFCAYGCKRIITRTFHISSPIWVKFGATRPLVNTMEILWSGSHMLRKDVN